MAIPINALVERVDVAKTEIRVATRREELVRQLVSEDHIASTTNDEKTLRHLILVAQVSLRRSGIETKLVYPTGPAPRIHGRSVKALQQALLKSMQWNQALLTGEVDSFEALIRRDNLNPRQTHRLRNLAFLAPDIVERIIAGDVPEALTLERLKKDFPRNWMDQYQHFGLKPSQHT